MSAILLSAILMEQYLSVAHNRFYKNIATKKVLTLAVILATVISTVWSLFTALYDTDQDATKKAKLYISGASFKFEENKVNHFSCSGVYICPIPDSFRYCRVSVYWY